MKRMSETETLQVNGGSLALKIITWGVPKVITGIQCLIKNKGLSNRSNCICGLHRFYK